MTTPLRLTTEHHDQPTPPTAAWSAWLDTLVAGGHLAAVSASALRVAVALTNHARIATGVDCWPSTARLGELCGLGRSATFAAIAELEDRGLIERAAPGQGRSTTSYRLTRPKPEVVARLQRSTGTQAPSMDAPPPPSSLPSSLPSSPPSSPPATTPATPPPHPHPPDPPPNRSLRPPPSPPPFDRSARVDPPDLLVRHGGPHRPDSWTPPSKNPDCLAQNDKNQLSSPPAQNKTTTAATSKLCVGDEFAAAVLLRAEGFAEADVERLSQLPDRVTIATQNADHLAAMGRLRSRRGYVRRCIEEGWPLIPEVAQAQRQAQERADRRRSAAIWLISSSAKRLHPADVDRLRRLHPTPASLLDSGALDQDQVLKTSAAGDVDGERRLIELIRTVIDAGTRQG